MYHLTAYRYYIVMHPEIYVHEQKRKRKKKRKKKENAPLCSAHVVISHISYIVDVDKLESPVEDKKQRRQKRRH